MRHYADEQRPPKRETHDGESAIGLSKPGSLVPDTSYAMTSTCTHAGCDMIADGRVNAQGVMCGCHNSRFDPNGRVKSGPARQPLQHFAVSVDSAGVVTVHGAEPVSASQRTATS